MSKARQTYKPSDITRAIKATEKAGKTVGVWNATQTSLSLSSVSLKKCQLKPMRMKHLRIYGNSYEAAPLCPALAALR